MKRLGIVLGGIVMVGVVLAIIGLCIWGELWFKRDVLGIPYCISGASR